MAGVQVDGWQGGGAKAHRVCASSDDNAAGCRLGAGNPTAPLLHDTRYRDRSRSRWTGGVGASATGTGGCMPPTVKSKISTPRLSSSASCCTIARIRAVVATRFSDKASASVRLTVLRITAR